MAVKEIISFDSKLLDTTSVYDSTQAKKQSAINADTLTALGTKINYTDALTLEEIEASTDLSNKVAAAAAVETLKESLSTIHSITCPVGTMEYHCGYVLAGKIVAVEAVIALTSAVSSGGVLLSGLPIQYANGAPIYAWNQTTTSAVLLAMNNQGELTTRSNIANGNSLRMNFCYRAV